MPKVTFLITFQYVSITVFHQFFIKHLTRKHNYVNQNNLNPHSNKMVMLQFKVLPVRSAIAQREHVYKHSNKIETNDFRENAKTGELAFSKSFLLMVSVLFLMTLKEL
jgi:hypothetical protein